MIACSQPLAAEAGQEILRKGGNAADAGTLLLVPSACFKGAEDSTPQP
jgi:hypothetical protein